jgi:hypothetical protein
MTKEEKYNKTCEEFQGKQDMQARIEQHQNNLINNIATDDGSRMILGVSGSGNWHTNKCANLDELDGEPDDGKYYES